MRCHGRGGLQLMTAVVSWFSKRFFQAFIGGRWVGKERFTSRLKRVGLASLVLGFAPWLTAKEVAVELSLFRDASAVMSLEEVLALGSEAFEPCGSEGPVLGFTGDAIWLRARVVNHLDQGHSLAAELGIARLSEVVWQVYAERGGGLESLELKDLGLRHPAVAFELPARTEGWILVKVVSDTTLHLPLRVWPLADFPVVAKRRDGFEMVTLSLGLGVVLATLVMGLYTRMRQFYLLCLYVTLYLVYQFAFDGFVSWIWPAAPHWMERNLLLVLAAGIPGIHLLFTSRYQQGSGGSSGTVKILWWTGQVAIGVALANAVVPFGRAVWINSMTNAVWYAVGTLGSMAHVLRIRSVSNALMALGWWMAVVPGALVLVRIHNLTDTPLPLEPIFLVRLFTPAVALVSLSAVVVQASRNQSERERRLRAEQATTMAQLQALRYQINPHFLYNTLNGMDALAHEAPARLSVLVRKLAAFLRMRLMPSPNHLTSLRDEMEAVRAYLAIEKVRFEERLQVVESIDEAALVCQVPDLLLQSLVENAVKHSHSEDSVCRVWVVVNVVGDRLHLTVENTGSLQRAPQREIPNTGIGHSNMRERLKLQYPNQATFSIIEREGKVLASICFPRINHL